MQWIRPTYPWSSFIILLLFDRFLGFNTFSAYQRARYSAVKILGRHFAQRDNNNAANNNGGVPGATANVATISSEVLVDMNASSGLSKLPESAI